MWNIATWCRARFGNMVIDFVPITGARDRLYALFYVSWLWKQLPTPNGIVTSVVYEISELVYLHRNNHVDHSFDFEYYKNH